MALSLKRAYAGGTSSGSSCKRTRSITKASFDDSDVSNSDLDDGSVELPRLVKTLSAISTPIEDGKLSKAVSQYSDDDEDDDTNSFDTDQASNYHHRRRGSMHVVRRASTSFSSAAGSPPSMPTGSGLSPSNFAKNSSTSLLPMLLSPSSRRNYLPDADFVARSRCFDYLVGAIDEVWARYCDSTAHDEEVAYGYAESGENAIAVSPDETNTSEEEYGTEASASTSITEYDSDFKRKNGASKPNMSVSIMGHHRRVSEVPANVKLQKLKDRLIKAKYYLQDYVDSDDLDECSLFWKKWDLVKYSAIELVEDDDEDAVIEDTIDSLEEGRYYAASVDA